MSELRDGSANTNVTEIEVNRNNTRMREYGEELGEEFNDEDFCDIDDENMDSVEYSLISTIQRRRLKMKKHKRQKRKKMMRTLIEKIKKNKKKS
mmetsp:Transcript_20069/g.22402  ORF Transcript_20069/g.22402 Transcript_20069/m.22402 type:complete len:94 (+) Transcript_20069:385-666(+)